MMDKCDSHLWARAQNQPSKREKMKSILLLSTLCSLLFAFRETPDLQTKHARTTSVIYPPSTYQSETNKTKKKHHNTVFLNTKPWDSTPYASLEGSGTTLSEKCQRWPNTRPLGAAMRLTALHLFPTDIFRQSMNSMQLKPKPKPPNDLYPHLLCDSKHVSPESGKCIST